MSIAEDQTSLGVCMESVLSNTWKRIWYHERTAEVFRDTVKAM
jgi:hypothetical protein